MKKTNLNQTAYIIGVVGLAINLLWIGLFKFTPTEAAGIKSLVESHFAMSWLYSLLSVQGVSNLIGSTEIIIALALFLSLIFTQLGKYAGICSSIIFITTLSFLFTTPGICKSVDGFPITNFFILKDITLLSISLMVWARGNDSAFGRDKMTE